MSLLAVLIAIVVVGLLLWVFNSSGWIPLDPKIKRILNIVVVIFLVIWLLRASGIWSAMAGVRL